MVMLSEDFKKVIHPRHNYTYKRSVIRLPKHSIKGEKKKFCFVDYGTKELNKQVALNARRIKEKMKQRFRPQTKYAYLHKTRQELRPFILKTAVRLRLESMGVTINIKDITDEMLELQKTSTLLWRKIHQNINLNTLPINQ